MYRPPDSRIEFNDRYEEFIHVVSNQNKEFILLQIGDFNRNLLNPEIDRDWGNFTSSLGLTQLISEPTRVTQESQTLIDHIYTNNEETINSVYVEKMCISDHFAVFAIENHMHQFVKITIKQLHIGLLKTLTKLIFFLI